MASGPEPSWLAVHYQKDNICLGVIPTRAGPGVVTRLVCVVVGVESVTGLKEMDTMWFPILTEGSGCHGLQHVLRGRENLSNQKPPGDSDSASS